MGKGGTTMTKICIISGLSGAGKDTVITELKKQYPLSWVITTTTRPMRPGESEGNPYHFVSVAEFERMIMNDELIEHAKVYDYYYGPQKKDVAAALAADAPAVIMKVDYQGAESIKALYPEAIVIFIVPPSMEILKQRLITRGQDSSEVIERRLAEADTEMARVKTWSHAHHVVNEQDQLDKTVEEVYQLIQQEAR